ncbi:MAG: hypothetical protein AB1760_16015 [Pseudomonadota bacterium]
MGISSTRTVRQQLCTALCAAALTTAPILTAGCGIGTSETSSGTSADGSGSRTASEDDRAARLAAQSQLRNAQTAQEAYYAENEVYAANPAQLSSIEARLSPKLKITRGDMSGYEMSIAASDSAGTVYIVRRTSSGVERVDGEGNSW